MSQSPIQLPKQPVLKPAEDFYRLRRDGIGYIEQMGSRRWTDYNTHDPGITTLEALSYTLTDLAYRIGWDIKDLLTSAKAAADPGQPYPNQAFFTARTILTVNPWTTDDFRRLLIDLDGVRNAWVFCKACACDAYYYAWCEKDLLKLAYQKPADLPVQPKKVEPQGLYDILLELESDPELGDLNDRKIEHRYSAFDAEGKSHDVLMELRFPEWGLEKQGDWKLFLDSADAFAGQNGASFKLTRLKFNRTKAETTPMTDAQMRSHWRNVFYVSFEIELLPASKKIAIENAALRLFGDTMAKNQATVAGLEAILFDPGPLGFMQRYRHKLLLVKKAVDEAKDALQAHRNLDEDYCRVKGVTVEDVAVCADVEVSPDADIERVQAQIWFQIEQYFNPPVPFYSLQELMDAGLPVEAIFNGPELANGFIKADELAAAGLRPMLRTSDIINRLMDIEGVVAVNNLMLSKYDAEGNVIKGAADPTWSNDKPVFDANQASASWLLFISDVHQPRLYHNLSRFLFYKNGLPFLPRMDEARDALTQLHGEAERPKIKGTANDLPVPLGTFRNPQDYSPVQYSFPMAYGIGPAGLPSHASLARRAQAKQLKAYLLVFEQLLSNAFAQIARSGDLFSLDPTLRRTYFVQAFSEAVLKGYSELVSGLTNDVLEDLTETEPEYLERRNRFLDHIMARFGEQFGEYALLLTNLQGQQVALDQLIEDKLSFLKAYPVISHDRARAFNYRLNPCAPANQPGLQRRIKRLIGLARSSFKWSVSGPVAGAYTVAFELMDEDGATRLKGALGVTEADETAAKQSAFERIVARMRNPEAYEIAPAESKFQTILKDGNGLEIARTPDLFATASDATAAVGDLILLAPRHRNEGERCIVVEHVLLRPKFPGDALYPVCADGGCAPCGDEDPYSFRLTVVMPGWAAPFDTNLDLRDFADRTIRQEIPAHLLGKICWVGNEGFAENVCAPVVSALATLLEKKGVTASEERPTKDDACTCAATLYAAFSAVFKTWYDDKTLLYVQADALTAALIAEFADKIKPGDLSCVVKLDGALWAEVQATLVNYFHYIALYGWQFERFEDAWCQWLDSNAAFDWTEERLQERVEAILTSNVLSATGTPAANKEALCKYAASILATYGMSFYNWMDKNFRDGHSFDQLTPFVPDLITLCTDFTFKPDTAETINTFLNDRYAAYKRVSYQLWIVVNLLSKLRNTYPGATLHDCDDGSDRNPVQLGRTALGA